MCAAKNLSLGVFSLLYQKNFGIVLRELVSKYFAPSGPLTYLFLHTVHVPLQASFFVTHDSFLKTIPKQDSYPFLCVV